MLQNSVAKITFAYEVFPICATMVFTTVIYVKLLFIAWQKTNEVENVQGTRDNVTEKCGDGPKTCSAAESSLPQYRLQRSMSTEETIQRIGYNSSFNVFFMYHMDTLLFLWHQHECHIADYFNFVPLSYTWIQPIVYLLTNPEARMLFFKLVRCNRANEPFN